MATKWTDFIGEIEAETKAAGPEAVAELSARREKIAAEVKHFVNGMPAIHPGEILRGGYLEPLELSIEKFAAEIEVHTKTLDDVVAEREPITDALAEALSKGTGTSAQFWLNLQRAYDEAKARDERP